MKLVTNTCALTEKLQFGESLELIARAGFDGVDCSFFDMKGDDSVWNGPGWREFAKEMRLRAEDLGLVFRQAHAPFPSARDNEDYNKMIFPRILRSMEAAAIMGVENIVVHPIHYGSYWENREEQYRRSLDFYRELIPYCKEFGIRVCTENMWSRDKARTIRDSLLSRPEEFCAFVDELDSPYIGACLDLGHAALVGQEPANMIKRMGTRLTCLHVHDVDYLDDKHTLPFTQSLAWEEITRALGEIGYRGDFTFEAEQFVKKMPQELWPDALKMMAAVGRYLIGRIRAGYPG